MHGNTFHSLWVLQLENDTLNDNNDIENDEENQDEADDLLADSVVLDEINDVNDDTKDQDIITIPNTAQIELPQQNEQTVYQYDDSENEELTKNVGSSPIFSRVHSPPPRHRVQNEDSNYYRGRGGYGSNGNNRNSPNPPKMEWKKKEKVGVTAGGDGDGSHGTQSQHSQSPLHEDNGNNGVETIN